MLQQALDNLKGDVAMRSTYDHYIGGKFVAPVKGEYFDNPSPIKAKPRAPLVVLCRADCWMSWNAARRIRAWGFRDVRWYGPGSDGWAEMGLALRPARPFGDTSP